MAPTTQMRRVAPRELLPLLLAPPAVGAVPGRHQSNPHIQRIAARLRRGDVATIPACEMRQIFSLMAEECRGGIDSPDADGTCIARERGGDRPPRKRARRCSNNNMHALMKFVERTINRRYMKQQRCTCEDEQFLDDELRGHFGTEEASFRAEEDVLCLAFEMAANAIRQSCGGDGDTLPSVLTVRAVSSSGAIQTALQIFDSVVLISKRERAAVRRLQQLAKPKSHQSCKAKSGDRRSKYEHLLRPSKRSRKSGLEPHHEEKSVMEERYPEQWEWMNRFRARGESTCQSEADLQQSHFPQSNPQREKLGDGEGEQSGGGQFVIVRRKTPTLDDISVSSDESDADMNLEGAIPCDGRKESESAQTADMEASPDTATTPPPEPATAPTAPEAEAASPYEKLDKEARELRLALLDMPPGEATSMDAVQHTVDEIGSLLARYGELDGAAGIARCGDIVGGIERSEESTRFPLNDALVSALVKDFFTDAMGALRAKAFLRSFVLPLLIEMNPTACAASIDSVEEMEKAAKAKGKAASRSLTSLLATLARDRPTECVISLVVPSLVLRKYLPSIAPEMENLFEPARFQCELISRILRGRDALSPPAVATLIEQVLPAAEWTSCDARTSRGGMKWTEHSMPLLTAFLNRQPTLSDEVVAKLADEIMFHMSPKAPLSMAKSMKFSSLFHALVMKYGPQLQSTGRVEHLKDTAGRLKTFMSKTIGLSLKKLS